MALEIDVSEVLALTADAQAELLRDFPRAMAQTVAEAARAERQTHPYTNRTGNAQRSTRASIVSRAANDIEIEAEAGAEYASYLARGGWSDFDGIMGNAQVDILNGIELINRRLSR
jgi:hypothetical protein